MALKEISVANTVGFINGSLGILSGKNGFLTTVGSIPLVSNSFILVDSGSNIELTVSHLDNVFDENFSNHVLDVNNGFFAGLKGVDSISIPIEEKVSDGSLIGFVGNLPTVTRYSANIVAFDLNNNTVKINNIETLGQTLFDRIETPPFWVRISQIIDTRFFNTRKAYLEGSFRDIERVYDVVGISGIFTANLGVVPTIERSDLIHVFVDGIELGTSDFTFTEGTDFITTEIGGSEVQIRTKVDYYTVPAFEPLDELQFFSENVYVIEETSYSVESANYNAALTTNNVFWVKFSENLKANLSGATVVNITDDLVGTVNNVNAISNTFTLDFDENIYINTYNLSNNKIYRVDAPIVFDKISIGTNRRIEDVPLGINMVRARNINQFGRLSPYATASVDIRQLAIRRVTNLTVEEQLLKDTSQGVIVNLLVCWDHITGQEVTDYEISFKLDRPGSPGTFNTVKMPATGVDPNGRMAFIINNIDRGSAVAVNNAVIKVTPLNGTIVGIPSEAIISVIGKSAPPLNVINIAGGQSGQGLILVWEVPKNPDGTVVDIDLMETRIRKFPGIINPVDMLDTWPFATPVAIAATPATNISIPLIEFGEFTFLFRTRDTSGNESINVVGITLTLTRPVNVSAFKTWSEDDPTGNVVPGIPNENVTEGSWPSFANTVTGGVTVQGGTPVDNANGTSSGWSVIGGAPTDLQAAGLTAFYQTQVRDATKVVTGQLLINANGSTAIKTTFNDLREIIFTGASETAPVTNTFVEVDFGGIGHILGLNNANAAVVTYDANMKTLVSGGVAGNVYALWNPGQFVGDISNANSFALIAGVINANAVELSNTFFGNGMPTFSNSLANFTTTIGSYELVNLTQFLDPDAQLSFSGPDGGAATNVEIRTSTVNVFFANGNVDSTLFTGGSVNEGWVSSGGGNKLFRWFQVRFTVNVFNPQQIDFFLDKIQYTVDLEDKIFTTEVNVTANPTEVDYTLENFLSTPTVTLTIVGADEPLIALVADKSNTAANIKVFNNVGAAADSLVAVQAIGV